jgi:guanylate kinase
MEEFTGHLVLLMAPSGSGKKMLVDGLGELRDNIYFAKTYTSRAQREGTEENPKYTFVDKSHFEELITKDEFIEWANFSGNLYGTPKSEIIDPLRSGEIVFKEMELQGVQQIKELVPKDKLTVIYIDAGSWEELRARVLARASISDEELELRHQRYDEEVKFKPEADIVIQNKNGEAASAQAKFQEVIGDIIRKVNL